MNDSAEGVNGLPTGTVDLPLPEMRKVPPQNWRGRVQRYRKWAGIVVVSALLIYVFRATLLSTVANGLIYEDPVGEASAVAILDGDRRFELAAEASRNHRRKVLILQGSPGRLERLKVVPPAAKVARDQLTSLGVPDEQIEVLAGAGGLSNLTPVLIDAWLDRHPGESVEVYCDRFRSRRLSWRLSSMPQPQRSRIRVRAIRNLTFDESNWSTKKTGILAITDGYLRLAFGLTGLASRTPYQERSSFDFARAAFCGS